MFRSVLIFSKVYYLYYVKKIDKDLMFTINMSFFPFFLIMNQNKIRKETCGGIRKYESWNSVTYLNKSKGNHK